MNGGGNDVENFRTFKPAGPVAEAFLLDRTSEVRAIMGPVGGGKSVSCVYDMLLNAGQMPICRDGKIRYRLAIIGNTYGQIERNLFPTYFEWLPRTTDNFFEAELKGGGGRQAFHKVGFKVIRGGVVVQVECEVIFAAIGEQAVQPFMRGFEPTAFWLYEMDQMPETVLTNAIGRIGRYPPKKQLRPGDSYRPYVVGDLNAPDIDHWFVKAFDEQRVEGYTLYRQPGARTGRAENVQNLPDGYYDRLIRLNAKKPRWITRFIDCEYGPSEEGEPVYPEYSDALHLSAAPLKASDNLPVKVGFDQGLTRPAGVIAQRTSLGQWRILAEVVPGRMNARRFAAQFKQVLGDVAPNAAIQMGWCDPAGFTGADKEAGEFAWAEIVARELGFPILPTETNEIEPRLTAVKDELTFMIDSQTPAFILSRGATPMLRKGFASHYRYKRSLVGGGERYSDKPEKNDWSNPHDALQYLLLGEKGRYGVISGSREIRSRRGSRGTTIGKSDFNVFES